MNFWNIALFEALFVLVLVLALGLIKTPLRLRRKKLVQGSPWGYYEGQIPRPDGEYFPEDNQSFLYNTGTKFEGVPGLGILGEFAAHGFGAGMSDW